MSHIFKNKDNKLINTNNKILTTIWKPNKIEDILLWINSDRKNLKIINNKIYKCNDLSGKMNNLYQENTTNAPTYINNQINSYPVMYFNNDDFLQTQLNINYFSIFTVFKLLDNDYIYNYGDISTSGFYLNGDINTIAASKDSGLTNSSIKKYTNSWGSSGNTWKLVSHLFGGTHDTHLFYLNTHNYNLTTYSNYDKNIGDLNTTDIFKLGGGINGMNGYIAETVIYNRYLNDIEKSKVEDYLINKYNISTYKF